MGCLKLAHWNEMEIPTPRDRTENEPSLRCVWKSSEHSKMGVNWYDYGFRFYDPALGRFPSLDPKADEFPQVSTYNYAENRPIDGIDLWGLQWAPAPYKTSSATRASWEIFFSFRNLDKLHEQINKYHPPG